MTKAIDMPAASATAGVTNGVSDKTPPPMTSAARNRSGEKLSASARAVIR
jgi:hypothetical protein